jgi:hypothetical protein
MGICISQEVAAKRRSDKIDIQIEEDMARMKKEVKILLLGIPSSPSSERTLTHGTRTFRLRRVRKDDYNEANENHAAEWFLNGRTS